MLVAAKVLLPIRIEYLPLYPTPIEIVNPLYALFCIC